MRGHDRLSSCIMMLGRWGLGSGERKATCSTPLLQKEQKHALYCVESLTVFFLTYVTGIARRQVRLGTCIVKARPGLLSAASRGGGHPFFVHATAAVKEKEADSPHFYVNDSSKGRGESLRRT